MSVIDFDGFVLRAPRISAANSEFTAEPDTFVRPQDEATYTTDILNDPQADTTEYLVQAAYTGDLVVPAEISETAQFESEWVYTFNSDGRAIASLVSVTGTPDEVDLQAGIVRYPSDPGGPVTITYAPARLGINWTKNDTRTRFGYRDTFQRWETLPGAPPENLGAVPESGLLELPVVETQEPLLVLGTPDADTGTVVPVPGLNRLSDDQFQDYVNGTFSVPAGEAVMNTETGDILLASNLITAFLNQDLYFIRSNFFSFDSSSGRIGSVGDALFMNPFPETSEAPRIRIGYRSYLRGEQSTILTVPSGGFDYVWNPDNGRVYLDPTLLTDFDGESVYYDGVFSNVDPVTSYAHATVGTIDPSNVFSTPLGPLDLSTYGEDDIILYVEETGEAIEIIEFVDDAADLEVSFNLRGTSAQVVRGTGQLELGLSFRSANDGNTLVVGTNAFPIEKGISFRWNVSPVDPTNERGTPDGRSGQRVSNEILSADVPAGPSYRLNQIPLVDGAGYDTNTFFRLQNGARQRLLVPDVDVIYDFDNQQLLWLDQSTFATVITAPTYGVQLPDQLVHDTGFTFLLNEGVGFQPLVNGQTTVIDFNTGQLTFVDRRGTTLATDVGVLGPADTLTATTEDLSSLVIPTDDLEKPVLLLLEEAYRVTGSTATTVTVDRNINLSGTAGDFEVLESPEVVYRQQQYNYPLRERTVYPFIVSTLDAGGTNYAPAGESLEFLSDGSTVGHTFLSPEIVGQLDLSATLPLPAFYQAATARFSLLRQTLVLTEVGGAPAEGEFQIVGTDIIFNAADATNFEGEDIVLVPELSVGRTTGAVEVLTETREVGLPSDLTTTSMSVRALVAEEDYTQQGPTLFFERPFRSGEQLFVRYNTDESTVIEEPVGFQQLEDVTPSGGQQVVGFGAGITLDPSRPTTVLVNGHSSSLTASGKTVSVAGVRRGRKVQVSFFSLEAQGGEQVVGLLNDPYTPLVFFEPGDTQSFQGDHTSVLGADVYLRANSQSFEVVSASYDVGSNTTTVVLSPDCLEELRDPVTVVSSRPIDERSPFSATVQPNSREEQELYFFGDFTGTLKPRFVLYMDGDPYRIVSSEFLDTGQTRVTVESGLMQEYSAPTLEVSVYPLYEEEPSELLTSTLAFEGQPLTLVRFLGTGEGEVLEEGTDYRFEAGGRIVLNTTRVNVNLDDVWQLAYTALREVGPTVTAGQTFFPRFQGAYSKRVNATEENGIKGSLLRGTFDFPSPDSFYFRVVSMEDYALEVSEELDQLARAGLSSAGPLLSTTSSSELYDQGSTGLIWRGKNYRDQDRAARDFLQFYNEVISLFENLLEVVDGRVIGDLDGKFLFELRANGSPGGIDPITGELIPFYANPLNAGVRPISSEIETLEIPDQVGTIRNFIDDIVFVSKKKIRIQIGLPLTLEFEGTFRRAWEPSRLSRLYPEEKQVFTITVDTRSGGADYTFGADFLRFLADAGDDTILSANNIRKRAAKARIRLDGTDTAQDGNGGEVRLRIGMEFDRDTGDITNTTYDPTTGIPELYISAFAVDDHVNLGRVTFSKTGDVVTKTTTIYGENLVVTSVGSDYIEVRTNPDAGSHPDLTATNATSLSPLLGDTVYTIPPVMVNTGAFDLANDPPPYYRQPIDLFVNSSGGELLNTKVPNFLAGIINQAKIDPFTFLDMTLQIKNSRTTPFRFPALDGSPLDDDGDQKPPFAEPFQDSELQRLNAEILENESLRLTTDEGIVFAGTITNTNEISTGIDLTGQANVPHEFDLVVVEDEESGGNSTIYSVASISPTQLFLAAFVWLDAAVGYDISSLRDGTGVRDGINTRWNDAGFDFTALAGVTTATLNIGASSYTIVGFNNGSVDVSIPIVETGPEPYSISVTGTGAISQLDRLETPGVSCVDASGTVTITGSGPNNGTYNIGGGGVNILYPELLTQPNSTAVNVGISSSSTIATGTGDVVVGTDTLETTDSVTGILPGQMLTIPSSSINAGRYTVQSVTTGAPNEIVIEESFFQDEVGPAWRVDEIPRRFSDELTEFRDELVQQRVTYALNTDAPVDIAPLLTATSGNPSAPYKERLISLRDLLFESVVLVAGAGEVVSGDSAFEGTDFVAADVQVGDFVFVEAGVNAGFYPVIDVDSGVSPQQLVVQTTNSFTTYTLTDEVGMSFEVLRGSLFNAKTYELVLYEYSNVLGIIGRIDTAIRVATHDPNDLVGVPPLGDRPGDPTDVTLLLHDTEVDNRLAWIRDASPNLRDEITATLRGREALYDIRYAWIDFRTNLKRGTLPVRARFEANLTEQKAERRLDLLKLLSTGNG